jgi:hypothetical protein
MAYREFQPIAALRHRVDAYWVNRRDAGDGTPIDSSASRNAACSEGLQKVATFAREHEASVAMPRIGTGLAGGDWKEIEPVIEETLGEQAIPVRVYHLP